MMMQPSHAASEGSSGSGYAMSTANGDARCQKSPGQQIRRGAFKQDIVKLFGRKRGGHTERWMYHNDPRGAHQPTGSQLWSKFLAEHGGSEGSYYVLREDIQNIQDAVPTLAKRFNQVSTVVDFGSGDPPAVINKAVPIVKGLANVKIYVPIDLSEGLLELANKAANDNMPGVQVRPIQADFFKKKMIDGSPLILPGKNRLGLLLGSTITNTKMNFGDPFPEQSLIKEIKALGEQLARSKGKSGLAISFDSNADLKGSALKAYDEVHWSRMMVGLMIDVENILSPRGKFNPFKWHHEFAVDCDKHVIHHCLVADEDQEFWIDDDFFKIDEGEAFVVFNTFKFPVDLFQSIVRRAGYDPHDPIIHQNGRLVLQTMDVS